MSFQLRDNNQMFGVFQAKEVISVYAFHQLQGHVRNSWGNLSPQEQANWEQIEMLTERLPQKALSRLGQSGDFPEQRMSSGKPLKTKGLFYVIRDPSTFEAKPTATDHLSADPQDWGVAAAVGLLEYAPIIKNFIRAQGLNITFNQSALRRAAEIQDHLNKGVYTIVSWDPIEKLGETKACAVFVPGSPQGYLDYRGRLGSLGSARLFEGAGAAYEFINDEGLQNQAVVVHLQTQVVAIDPNHNVIQGLAPLNQALAHQQRKTLTQEVGGVNEGTSSWKKKM